ncbi:transcription-repair coupling factor [Isoalcanivorax pacificus W11-5]|uniref:Transcription-repair-coupling factor n=1 Tax=Isoalcanivorax pacificus W11-5 TaxID=391936 RepID=A0A0B4XNT6_9GAMM|nr:transcription-repair coupling factor [Isoalcanivorax pacificus]AJD48435.1 transcription-repair coupling factor [Isoalcanivorax pacificus W11-5]
MTLLPANSLFPTGAEHFRDWSGLDAGSLAVVLAEVAARTPHLLLVVTPNSSQAQQLADSLTFYLASQDDTPVLLFPDWETLPYDLFSPHQDIISERIEVLHRLPHTRRGILIAPVNTLMQRLAPLSHINGNSFQLRVGERFDMETTRRQLVASGYRQRDNVYEHGEFAVRGAIMDIFPMGAEQPFRIELFDEDIDSLRLFDPDTQRSTGQVQEIALLPAAEFSLSSDGISSFRNRFRERFDVDHRQCSLYTDVSDGMASPGLEYYLPLFFDQLASLFDYLPDDVHLVQLAGTEDAASHFWHDVGERFEDRRHDIRRPILSPAELFLPVEELNRHLRQHPRARVQPGMRESNEKSDKGVPFDFRALPPAAPQRSGNPFAPLQTLVMEHAPLRVLVCAETAGRREALLELMQKQGIQPTLVDGWQAFLAGQGDWQLTVGELEQGFWAPQHGLLVVAESQLYGERIMQRRRRKTGQETSADQAFRSLGELVPGSPVVHIDHGVGRYQGLTHMTVDGQQHEFLLLEYAGGDKIYLPVSSLHLISRYGGGDPEHAPLTRLGSDQWQRARQKAAEKIHDVAAELLNTYARREARQGRAFQLPEDDYARFASAFPFEETADQQAAIAAVLRDLQANRPMDRLVCGDVGFGKTEVAMRATFVAVQNNTQVAVLVPTTLLAQQHFESFSDRFADWPVTIEVLSRFRSQKEKTDVLARLKAGKVDIVVGTHQLLQESVQFRDLGLVVVDEEHRFGVRHKERLKEMRAEADILTLTATPIPRTLNMAMSGMRDISIIATPPEKRLSVKTFVQQKNDTAIKEAILRELLRGGQLYYLHNDIDSMARTAETLRELVPDARIGIAHGQMRERDLEQVMSDFYHRRFNVLLCTTIIETGIDVPSANTIIIERADKFGLAQLHQLRGRVGRSHHQAYAFLLTPPPKAMTKDAVKRLEAIEQASDLGAGFMLASHDLEIRGAGELLGEEQHGHIESIGFSLYMEMLEQAVEALKRGEQPDTRKPLSGGPEINLRVPALIPDDYLPDVFSRLTLYKRIASCDTGEQLDELKVEMIDRFGLLPPQVKNLFRVTALRQRAQALGVSRIDAGAEQGRLEFSERTAIDPLRLVKLVQSGPNRYKLQGASALRFSVDAETGEERFAEVEALLDKLA